MSRTHALWPPCYKKRLLRFHFSHSTGPVPYFIGQPVAITVEEVSIDGVQGHMLYRLVHVVLRVTWITEVGLWLGY